MNTTASSRCIKKLQTISVGFNRHLMKNLQKKNEL